MLPTVLTIASLATLAAPAAEQPLLLNVGEPAPPFAMRALDRSMFSLSDYTGSGAPKAKKALLLVFFATWCEPCKKEIPIIKLIYSRWQGKGVGVIYVGLSQGPKELEPFANEQNLPWPVVPDAFGLLGRRYGAAQLPHVFIIGGADGLIAFQHRGIAPDLSALLDEQLARLTGEAVPPAVGTADVVRPRFDTTLTLGRLPATSGSAARWQPLTVFLGESVSANIAIANATDYASFEAAIKEGKYDIANAGPLLCVSAREHYEPIAKIERQGTNSYVGIFFVKRDSAVKAIADLKGKKLGLVSPSSTSGGLYQKLALVEAGLNPESDLQIMWLGSHEKVAAAVKAGEVDAGGCYEDCRDSAWPDEPTKAGASRIVAYTHSIPGEMVVVKRSLDAAKKQALRKGIIAATNSTGLLAQISQGEAPITGFLDASDADLDSILAVIKSVEQRTTSSAATK